MTFNSSLLCERLLSEIASVRSCFNEWCDRVTQHLVNADDTLAQLPYPGDTVTELTIPTSNQHLFGNFSNSTISPVDSDFDEPLNFLPQVKMEIDDGYSASGNEPKIPLSGASSRDEPNVSTNTRRRGRSDNCEIAELPASLLQCEPDLINSIQCLFIMLNEAQEDLDNEFMPVEPSCNAAAGLSSDTAGANYSSGYCTEDHPTCSTICDNQNINKNNNNNNNQECFTESAADCVDELTASTGTKAVRQLEIPLVDIRKRSRLIETLPVNNNINNNNNNNNKNNNNNNNNNSNTNHNCNSNGALNEPQCSRTATRSEANIVTRSKTGTRRANRRYSGTEFVTGQRRRRQLINPPHHTHRLSAALVNTPVLSLAAAAKLPGEQSDWLAAAPPPGGDDGPQTSTNTTRTNKQKQKPAEQEQKEAHKLTQSDCLLAAAASGDGFVEQEEQGSLQKLTTRKRKPTWRLADARLRLSHGSESKRGHNKLDTSTSADSGGRIPPQRSWAKATVTRPPGNPRNCEDAFQKQESQRGTDGSMDALSNALPKSHCPVCSKRILYDVRKHIREVHLHVRPHVCNECGQKFSRAFNLRVHIDKTHKLKPPPPPRPRIFSCIQCHRNFGTYFNLKRHYNTVHRKI